MNCFCPLFSCDPKFFPVWFLLLPLQPPCNSLTLSSFLPTTCWNPVSKKPNYLVSGLTPGQLSTERKSHSCFPPQLSLQRHFIPAISSLSLWHHGSLLIHTFLFSSTLGSQRKSTGVFLTSCHQIYDLVLIYTHHFSPSHLQQRKQSPCNHLISPDSGLSALSVFRDLLPFYRFSHTFSLSMPSEGPFLSRF